MVGMSWMVINGSCAVDGDNVELEGVLGRGGLAFCHAWASLFLWLDVAWLDWSRSRHCGFNCRPHRLSPECAEGDLVLCNKGLMATSSQSNPLHSG